MAILNAGLAMLNVTELNCFVAAAEEVHFGRAAARLNITPVSWRKRPKIPGNSGNFAEFAQVDLQ